MMFVWTLPNARPVITVPQVAQVHRIPCSHEENLMTIHLSFASDRCCNLTIPAMRLTRDKLAGDLTGYHTTEMRGLRMHDLLVMNS